MIKSLTPIEKYESSLFCHHFTDEDHRELGRDTAKVFYKYLISNEENEL